MTSYNFQLGDADEALPVMGGSKGRPDSLPEEAFYVETAELGSQEPACSVFP